MLHDEQAYQAPAVEAVMESDDVEREVQYAGRTTVIGGQ